MLLTQGIDNAAIKDRCRTMPGGHTGIGWQRKGLGGAAQSMRDAIFAVAAASDRDPVADVRTDWLTAAILSRHDELAPLLEPVTAVATANPHLAAAVERFAEAYTKPRGPHEFAAA